MDMQGVVALHEGGQRVQYKASSVGKMEMEGVR